MIAIGSDHGGVELKAEICELLEKLGLEYKDFGTNSKESCDYPVYGEAVCRSITAGECDRGILVCGTGIGMSMAANKVSGIRAALCGDCYSAELTRLHNDANVLCLGARVLETGLALKITEIFLSTNFESGRHAQRIGMFPGIESRN